MPDARRGAKWRNGTSACRSGPGRCEQQVCTPRHGPARIRMDSMVHCTARRRGRPECPSPLNSIPRDIGSSPSPGNPCSKPPCGRGDRPRSAVPTGAAENAGRESSPGRSIRSDSTTTSSPMRRNEPDTQLLCSVAPRGDLVVESTGASGVDDIAPQRVRARVTRVETASADHAVVHLKVRRARVMRYLSGQRATVRFEPAPAARTRSSRGAAEDRFANGGRHASRRSSSASAQNCRYPFSTSTRNRGRSGWWVWSTKRPARPARDRRDRGPRPGTCLEQRERRHGGIGGIPTGNCPAPPVPANAGCRPRDAIRRSRIARS